MSGTTESGACQVRSKTEGRCPRRAAVEIRGIPFCGECAREQEAYFAVGELTQGRRGLRGKGLAEALKKVRRERPSTKEGISGGMQHRPASVYETKALALGNLLESTDG